MEHVVSPASGARLSHLRDGTSHCGKIIEVSKKFTESFHFSAITARVSKKFPKCFHKRRFWMASTAAKTGSGT